VDKLYRGLSQNGSGVRIDVRYSPPVERLSWLDAGTYEGKLFWQVLVVCEPPDHDDLGESVHQQHAIDASLNDFLRGCQTTMISFITFMLFSHVAPLIDAVPYA
jgi:hypothetical protein